MALLLGVACAPEVPSGPAARFDAVVLVTLDTLRADHLGAYGYPRPTSPFIDELARRGVLFERAYAPISTTVPSHATLFTSLYPVQHRLLRNGLVLGDEFFTLAERLAEGGFQTAAFVATGSQFGPGNLDQGFQHFDEPELEKGEKYRDADRQVDAVLDWLGDVDRDRPLFLWVHFFDVHDPLRPPPEHEALFAFRSEAERVRWLRFLVDRHGADPGSFSRGVRAVIDEHVRYDAEIHFADAELRRLYDGAVELGLFDRALWVVAGDHGQGMTRRPRRGHGRHIYEEQIRVPLLFHATDGSLAPHRVAGVVELADVLPSLLELVGVGLTAGVDAMPTQGRSLVTALRGGDTTGGREVLVQRRSYDPPPATGSGGEYELGEKFALVGKRWKYLHRTIGPDELYDLKRDPHETRNLIDRKPERAERMKRDLGERVTRLRGDGRRDAASVDPETIEQLEAMGYLQ